MSMAVAQHRNVDQSLGVATDENLVALEVRLDAALNQIQRFESERAHVIEAERAKYGFPFELVQGAVLMLSFVFVMVYLLSKVLDVHGPSHNVRHSQLTKTTWGVFFGATLGVLILIAFIQRMSHGELPALTGLTVLWWLPVICSTLVSFVSPALSLPTPETVLQRLPQEARGAISAIRKKRRDAYLSLVKRSLGVQFGLLLCAGCIWVIGYRVVVSIYPWMTPLLATGLELQEIETVRNILATLG